MAIKEKPAVYRFEVPAGAGTTALPRIILRLPCPAAGLISLSLTSVILLEGYAQGRGLRGAAGLKVFKQLRGNLRRCPTAKEMGRNDHRGH